MREEQKQSNFKNISKTYEKFSLVTLVTNYHKLSLRPSRKFEKIKIGVKFWILLLLLQMSYIFIASTRFKCTANNHKEINFCH